MTKQLKGLADFGDGPQRSTSARYGYVISCKCGWVLNEDTNRWWNNPKVLAHKIDHLEAMVKLLLS
jgi:hypothetical protein